LSPHRSHPASVAYVTRKGGFRLGSTAPTYRVSSLQQLGDIGRNPRLVSRCTSVPALTLQRAARRCGWNGTPAYTERHDCRPPAKNRDNAPDPNSSQIAGSFPAVHVILPLLSLRRHAPQHYRAEAVSTVGYSETKNSD